MELTDTVRQVLQQKGPEVWSVSGDTLVYQAIEMMAARRIGALLVISEGELAKIGGFRQILGPAPHVPSGRRRGV